MSKEENYYTIQEKIDIASASKAKCFGSGKPYTGDLGQITEWAAAVALAKYKIGQSVSFTELTEAMEAAMIQQALLELSDKNLIDMSWDENKQDLVYQLTKEAREAIENDPSILDD